MITNENKERIRKCVKRVNSSDGSLRKAAGEELISAIYEIVGDHERTIYNGIIYNMYINYDSNCGLTVVEANISLEEIANYIFKNEDINTITMDDGVRIMNWYFSERNEYGKDLIDENGYTVDEEYIMFILDYLTEEQKNYDKEFRQDLKDYKNRRIKYDKARIS